MADRIVGERLDTPAGVSREGQGDSPPEVYTGIGAEPVNLAQVLSREDAEVLAGHRSRYQPIPTGFSPLDQVLGGGLMRGELTLVGGMQSVGKTILALQMARNIAAVGEYGSLFICYEHGRAHLLNRLLCLEAGSRATPDQPAPSLSQLNRLTLEAAQQNRLADGDQRSTFRTALQENPAWASALLAVESYAERLALVKASPATVRLDVVRQMVSEEISRTKCMVVLFVDYLQKVSVSAREFHNEEEKTTILAEGLKDIAMALDIPVVVIAAADRIGLKASRLRLHDLRGSSALQYESDVVLILNNKYQIVSKNHIAYNPTQAQAYRNWVVFSIEKNRSGPAVVDIEFPIDPAHFRFDPQGRYVREQLIDGRIVSE